MKKVKSTAKGRVLKPAAVPPGESKASETSKDSCPIVAFGASAGGLEAFTTVLQQLPADAGMALVLVQHLDPQHASILADLLSRATSMRVSQVNGPTRVQPNRVYVIPPNRDLMISGGTLNLEPRPTAGPSMPIDRFFRSLAEDQGSKAIGVVLSGTASDGTQGVRAIKAAGGITFAQDPATAQYDGMPRSAIMTGCIDAILTPTAIADELVRLPQHPYLRAVPGSESDEDLEQGDRSLREIFNMLRNSTGVDFSLYKRGTVERRTMRRMALLKMDNLSQYAAFLHQNADEMTALFQDILINVTSFFREAATFDALKTRVLPQILHDRGPGDTVRVWVPGCATGEEVYSVAICLFEYMKETQTEIQVQIFGTDLSDAALEKARSGIYPETIAADVSPQRLRRFFSRVNSSYQIARVVRDVCIFARQNVTKDPPFSKCDLILCRNLLIYLGPALQNTAMRLFHYALQPHGYLVLGMSESIGAATTLFDPIDKKIKIYARKPVTLPVTSDFGAYQDTRHPEPRHEGKPPGDLLAVHHKVDQMLLARFAPAALVVDQALHIHEFRGHTAPYLEHAAGEASLDLTRMATGGLGVEVQRLVRRAQGKTASVKGAVSVSLRDTIRNVNLTVIPIQTEHASAQQFLVIIEEAPKAPALPAKKAKDKGKGAVESTGWQRVRDLEHELAAMREYLQTVVEEQEASTEELKSAHEEVQSGNEELQSTNEELLTAKEELQSTNEELTTVNEEMQGRNAELQQINNDLLNLLSSVNIPILMLGSDLRIRRFTPHAEKLFNLLATDVGRPVSDLRLKINVPDLAAICQEVLEDLSPREREVQDAEGRVYSMWVRPYRTTENRIDGVVMALFDVTERKQAVEARYKRLFEAAPDGIVIADAANGVILDVNPFLLKLSGYPRNRMIGARFWESPLFQDTGVDESLLQKLHETESIQKVAAVIAENGEPVETEIVCNLYTEGDRKVIQFNLRDISGRKRAEADLRQQEERAHHAQRMEAVGRLAGGVAHDFNNLLTALLGHCEFLERQLDGGPSDKSHLEQIRLAAERAGLLTRQLLAFGRKQRTRPAVLDLNSVVGTIQQLLAVMLRQNIHMDVKLARAPAPVNADRSQLEQVVLNLVLNARDAMPGGGQLTVQTGELTITEPVDKGQAPVPAGRYVTLTVKDTGIGMDTETKSRIFEPFFTTKPKNEGVGLGLSTTYSIVRQYGGYIVASSTLGAGATFTVYLPRADGEAEEAVPAAATEVTGGTETILVADDEPAVRSLAAEYLGGLGYRVLEAAGGPDALRISREHNGKIDLMLADVVMPNMSGREVAFQLAPNHPGMKVLYISGHNDEVIAHHGVLSNGVPFLQKPFRLPELGAKVRSVLDDEKEQAEPESEHAAK